MCAVYEHVPTPSQHVSVLNPVFCGILVSFFLMHGAFYCHPSSHIKSSEQVKRPSTSFVYILLIKHVLISRLNSVCFHPSFLPTCVTTLSSLWLPFLLGIILFCSVTLVLTRAVCVVPGFELFWRSLGSPFGTQLTNERNDSPFPRVHLLPTVQQWGVVLLHSVSEL